jgi:hypothetical protein
MQSEKRAKARQQAKAESEINRAQAHQQAKAESEIKRAAACQQAKAESDTKQAKARQQAKAESDTKGAKTRQQANAENKTKQIELDVTGLIAGLMNIVGKFHMNKLNESTKASSSPVLTRSVLGLKSPETSSDLSLDLSPIEQKVQAGRLFFPPFQLIAIFCVGEL